MDGREKRTRKRLKTGIEEAKNNSERCFFIILYTGVVRLISCDET